MRNLTLARSIAALGTLAIAAWGGQAYALEPGSADPHLPGVGDGVPAGALPPPGFYFVNTLAYNDGSLKNDGGNNATIPGVISGINATAWIEIPAVVWVTPLHFLGASYAVAIAQPVVTLSVTQNTAAGQGTTNRTGVFNTVITPGILSWHLPAGFFVSANFAIYLEDGDTDRGGFTAGRNHIANNTITFAPGGAISWFNGHGLETSINLEYDIQTENDHFAPGGVKYQSGDLLNLDFTAVQVLPGAYKKWTVGAVGFISTQTSDDVQTPPGGSTAAIPGFVGKGANFERIGLGPYVGYDFGPVGINFWYTRDVEAKNAAQGDTFFFRFAFPL